MSRPYKNANEKKSRQIIFRVSEDDYIPLRDIAVQAGMKPNQLARLLVLHPQKGLALPTNRIVDPALLKQLERIGNNLNQLVRNAHIYKGVSPKVECLCDDIRQIIEATLEAAGELEADE